MRWFVAGVRGEGTLERLSWFAGGLIAAAMCFLGYQVVVAPAAVAQPPPPPRPTPAPVRVQVAGAVLQPGVYEVPPAARVEDAVRAAGGPADTADVGAVNLLARVSDGERILIPRRGQPRTPTPRPTSFTSSRAATRTVTPVAGPGWLAGACRGSRRRRDSHDRPGALHRRPEAMTVLVLCTAALER